MGAWPGATTTATADSISRSWATPAAAMSAGSTTATRPWRTRRRPPLRARSQLHARRAADGHGHASRLHRHGDADGDTHPTHRHGHRYRDCHAHRDPYPNLDGDTHADAHTPAY